MSTDETTRRMVSMDSLPEGGTVVDADLRRKIAERAKEERALRGDYDVEAAAAKLLEELTAGELEGDCIGTIAEDALRAAYEAGQRERTVVK